MANGSLDIDWNNGYRHGQKTAHSLPAPIDRHTHNRHTQSGVKISEILLRLFEILSYNAKCIVTQLLLLIVYLFIIIS